nr:MAG TPA: hypothetical protein [Caudoviricetes sp.]
MVASDVRLFFISYKTVFWAASIRSDAYTVGFLGGFKARCLSFYLISTQVAS